MRIINLEEFRKMPENTIFMKFQPDVFESLAIKGETWDVDFLYSSITDDLVCRSSDEYSDLLDSARLHGKSIKVGFDNEGRDGCFDNDQLFAVYENDDILGLISVLNKGLEVT